MEQERFKEMLRDRKLKVTNQRLMVLDVIADHPGEHLTAEEIYELVKIKYPEIGLATIYRTVQVLVDLRVVMSFEDDLLELLEQEIYERMGFRVTDHEVKL